MSKTQKTVFVLLIAISVISTTGFFFLLAHVTSEAQFEPPSDSMQSLQHESIDVLCIGNSITLHQINSYWWGEWGMASSSRDKDYVHVLADMLGDSTVGAAVVPINFSVWEIQANDRVETYAIIDPYLVDTLKLVVIQLGENVVNAEMFEHDLEELVRFVQEKCPEAEVVVLGDFWDSGLDAAKMRSCKSTGALFVSLADIQGEEYQQDVGTIVQGENGEPHAIDHSGVAKHPNDAAHQVIAKKIMDVIRE